MGFQQTSKRAWIFTAKTKPTIQPSAGVGSFSGENFIGSGHSGPGYSVKDFVPNQPILSYRVILCLSGHFGYQLDQSGRGSRGNN